MRSAVLAGCRPRAAGIARLIRSTTTSQCAGGRSFSRTNHQREQSLSSSSSSSSSDHDSSNVVGGIDLSTLTNDSVVFSGIQPTGVPHIGNYFGALRQWKHMQDVAPSGAKLFFCIVDLHAITMPQDAHILQRKKAEMFAALMAIGLDPERSTIFYQSEVMAHSELMWILSCTASMGYLNRMTQWKTKMQLSDDAEGLDRDVAQRLKLGLFSYPVLQAADILVHRATHVPVGADQRQHLEFARECVSNFNHAYDTKCLVSPQTITTSSPRIMSLRHPTRKMSKSSPVEMSRIDITARPKVIRQRINSATTDMLNEVTWDPEARPGVANLLGIIAQCGYFSGSRTATAQDVAADFAPGETLGSLKKMTADALCHELEGVADRYHEILGLKGGKHIQELQELGAHRARESARETMHMVRDAVGLGAPRYRARLPQTKEELLD